MITAAIMLHDYCVFVVRTFRIQSLGNFEVCNAVFTRNSTQPKASFYMVLAFLMHASFRVHYHLNSVMFGLALSVT